MLADNNDTISAIATPIGTGGVGVVRLSGPQALAIAEKITGLLELPIRRATLSHFYADSGQELDHGLVLYFPAPNSYTGEDVVELQGHGGVVVQQLIVDRAVELGARLARPGEFTERAYLNDKMDLVQAEAVADLIHSSTEAAALGAIRSLSGVFSERIADLLHQLIELRVYVEAAIDFPEEEIDFLAEAKVADTVAKLKQSFSDTIAKANQGAILSAGLQVVIVGKPNAGKSSLLNTLSGYEAAIVTDIAGTTRDTIKEVLDLDGLPVHIIDTAGLRETEDSIEKIGIERTNSAIERADLVLYLIDASQNKNIISDELEQLSSLESLRSKHAVCVFNKSDKTGFADIESLVQELTYPSVTISAKNGDGIDRLIAQIKSHAGFDDLGSDTVTARKRHLDALLAAEQALTDGLAAIREHAAGELLAEDLLRAQNLLNEITGEFSADDLLGEIFSGFCIGK